MNASDTKFALLLAALTFPLAAIGQAAETSTVSTTADNTMEEMVVTGEKSLSQLRREVWEYEEEFYSRYNELNDDRDFAVRCYYETPTGSRIKNHVCRARYISNAYSASQSRKRGNANRHSRIEDDPEVKAKTEKFQANLQALIESDPELAASLAKYNSARERFMAQLNAEGNN